MNRTLLIDADITAFAIASNAEQKINFGGEDVYTADLPKALKEVDKCIARLIKSTSSQRAILFLTEGDNFRKGVLPTYKGNRIGIRKPMILQDLRDHMKSNFTTLIEPGIEADDLIGIHATMPHKGERVIFSADKDLKTIPGLHWCPEDGEAITISQREADRFFFEQCITGDATDNYKGCPGAGPAAASLLLDGELRWFKHLRTLKSGPNKGAEREEWVTIKCNDPWASVVSAYDKAGLTSADALVQARCARILRHGEYDFKQKKVILWEP